ncbi:murein biosynthesis integral membrane protein MurJ [Oryzomonas sagensis]|uniref:murein biosynthesis integral membrane protein MurJ n=1 Tax=Oryzomonas sagensis TaxID=2603857 RepID=UPI0017816880|nr:lipid II flippase MurJ [Oryzomonas sagensis]
MRLATILGSLTGINVLLTFIYQWYIVTIIGPGTETDSFFASMVVPQLILTVVTGSLIFVLVPILATEQDDSFHQETWNFFLAIGVLFSVTTVILYLTTNYWVPMTVPGFSPHSKTLTIALTKIQLVGMLFTALAGVLGAAYNAKQQFVWVSLSPVFSTIIGLIFLVCLLPRMGVMAAAWAMVLKMFIQMALLLPILGKFKRLDFESIAFKKAWTKLKPLLLGNTYSKTDQLIDRFLASMAPMGELSLLHLSQQIYGAGNQVITSAIASPMVPLLAQKASSGEWNTFKDISKKRLSVVVWLTGIILLVIIVIGRPILSVVFGHGRFLAAQLQYFWLILIALAGVLIGGAMGQILSTSFYAKGNTHTPTKIGVIGFSIGIVLKLTGFNLFGVIGVALANSIYLFLNAFIMQYYLTKNLEILIHAPNIVSKTRF